MCPAVSVLIPAYNRASLIGPCIDSALAQTYRDLEVVVVDNASTDGTWEAAERAARRDSRVRVFRNEENIGPVRNWRRCLEEAGGRLGKLLFSDDTMAPEYLARTVPLLDDPDIAFVFTAADVGEEPRTGSVMYDWPGRPIVAPSATYLADALCAFSKVPQSPGAAIFRLDDLRRDLVTDLDGVQGDFADHGAGPDMLLFLLAATRYAKVAHLSEPLSFFRFHHGSISISREALVRDRYHVARVWFALRHAPELLGATLGLVWADTCLAKRRIVSPAEIARSVVARAGGDAVTARIPPRELLRFGLEALRLAARGLVGRALRSGRS